MFVHVDAINTQSTTRQSICCCVQCRQTLVGTMINVCLVYALSYSVKLLLLATAAAGTVRRIMSEHLISSQVLITGSPLRF